MGSSDEATVAGRAPRRRPGRATRRFGYTVAVLVNLAMLGAIHVWPGWERLTFLTDETTQVLTAVDVSLLVGVAANLIYLARDPVWLKALGDLVTTTAGAIAMLRIWQVFPFDFTDAAFDWSAVVRVVLVGGIAGSAVGVIAAVVTLVRALAGGTAGRSGAD